MALLNIITPEKAEGDVKECYAMFENLGAEVPLPLQMLSVSPHYLKAQVENIKYLMGHPALSFSLMAHIRFLVASDENYPYCINLNRGMLKQFAGLSDEQVDAAAKDTSQAALEEKEKALLDFVKNVVQDPASSDQAQINTLRELGWTDRDIFDAVFQGVNMMAAGILFKIFHMGE